MPRTRVFLLVPTIQPHDAVGNDVLGMLEQLRVAGYETSMHAQFVHPSLTAITQVVHNDDASLFQSPRDLLIYHHAIDWELGESILRKARCKVVIKYHNVTPPAFYTGYAEHYFWACTNGVAATERIASIPGIRVWGDSLFNAREFMQLGVPEERCRVVAPLHKIDELTRIQMDSVVTGAYRDFEPNILFVGAFRPNKGHRRALEVFAAYCHLTDRKPRLFFVGSFDAKLDKYVRDIRQTAEELDVAGSLHFVHGASPAQLRSYYTAADIFLCVSEHEGFCVPLVEAMAFRVPIVAWATTAVGETAGDCGIVHETLDTEAMAASMDECFENPALARGLARRGRERYEEVFSNAAITRKLRNLVEEVIAE